MKIRDLTKCKKRLALRGRQWPHHGDDPRLQYLGYYMAFSWGDSGISDDFLLQQLGSQAERDPAL